MFADTNSSRSWRLFSFFLKKTTNNLTNGVKFKDVFFYFQYHNFKSISLIISIIFKITFSFKFCFCFLLLFLGFGVLFCFFYFYHLNLCFCPTSSCLWWIHHHAEWLHHHPRLAQRIPTQQELCLAASGTHSVSHHPGVWCVWNRREWC